MNQVQYRTAAGALVSRASSSEVSVPKGATALTQAEYNAEIAKIQDAVRGRDEAAVVSKTTKDADLKILVGLGVPEATARRIVGG